MNKTKNAKQATSVVPQSKITMTIELKEKQINLEGKYSVPKMWKVIDEFCSHFFTKISEGYYRLNEGENILGALLALSFMFESQPWLIPNLSRWIAGDEKHQDDYLAAYYRSKEKEKLL